MGALTPIITSTIIVIALILQLIEADEQRDGMFCEDGGGRKICTPISNEVILDSCRDHNDNCARWASEGECQNNPNYMHKGCALSCKECTLFSSVWSGREKKEIDMMNSLDVVQEEMLSCKDEDDKCAFWQDKGECEKNAAYMDVSCARSCGKCPSETTTMDVNDAERENLSVHLQAMNKYRESYRSHPNTTAKMDSMCTNRLSKCAYYATKGLCEDKVIFMMEQCPLACMMCDEKKQFDQCIGMRDPHSYPLFVNEDEYDMTTEEQYKNELQTIDSFFASNKDNSEWEKYGADYLLEPLQDKEEDKEGSWMVRFENFLTPEDCAAVIDLGKEIGLEHSTSTKDRTSTAEESKKDEVQKTIPTRSSKIAKCSTSTELCNDHDILSTIKERVASITKIPVDHFEPVEIEVFPSEGSGYHTLHHDFNIHDSWKMAGPTVMSLYIPLTSVTKGGYLGFPALDWLMVPPQAGQMIVWPNVLSKDPEMIDASMGKEILPVQKGDLYVLHMRAHLHSVKTAVSRGCY